MACSPPGSSVHGILQERLEWVAMPFSRGYYQPRHQTQVSRAVGRLFTIWATREVEGSNPRSQICPTTIQIYKQEEYSYFFDKN